jgi:GH15 family glucan-1,4-alpha-glucosidase
VPDRPRSCPPIEDYALIGDCGSAALVSRDGSIDWLCWPRFDSPSVFGALLDADEGGSFQVRPTSDFEVERCYLEETNVLETTFHAENGVLRLTDLMPVAEDQAYDRKLWPEHEVLRRVECVEGEVTVQITCAPRFEYGRVAPRLDRRGELGFFYTHGEDVLVLRSAVPLECSGGDDDSVLRGRATLREGERRYVALAYDQKEPAVLPLLGDHAGERVERSVRYWRGWAGRCQYDGPYRDAVMRSVLTLKLMTYSISGAIVAAPTSSVPEVIGGSLNWDYRYCWLRDAAFTLRVLFQLGYKREGEAFLSWLLQATRRTFPDLKVFYDVHGNTDVEEQKLDFLDGYKGSRPVRLGNGAISQFQLDVYGEIIGAAYEAVRRDADLDAHERNMLRKLGEAVCDRWQEKDNGIWEVRGERCHRTYSKAACWVALDRLLQLREENILGGLPTERFNKVKREIRQTIEEKGFSEKRNSYVAAFSEERLDAALLLLSVYGYADASADRMQATYERIDEDLGTDGLLYRYLDDDGGTPDEGTFGICSFWAVEHLAKAGRLDEARERFEHVLEHANDVGLYAEEIDAETGALLGNFPQAFTHVGLVSAALTLKEAAGGEADADGE